MALTKMSDQVEFGENACTLRELDDRGMVEFTKETSKNVTRYYAWKRKKAYGWEISKELYEAAMRDQARREAKWAELDRKLKDSIETLVR